MAFTASRNGINTAFASDKGQRLAAASEEKKQRVDWKTTTLSLANILDGDTLSIPDGTGNTRNMRLSNAGEGRSFDAFELDHDTSTMTPERKLRTEAKIRKQREALAYKRGVDVEDVSDQDVFDAGFEAKNALYQHLLGNQSPVDKGGVHDTSPTFEYATSGEQGQFGRELGMVKNRDDEVSNVALNTDQFNANFNTRFNEEERLRQQTEEFYAGIRAAETRKRKEINGISYKALSDEEADTAAGVATDVTARVIRGAVDIAGMIVDLPLAGVEAIGDNIEVNPNAPLDEKQRARLANDIAGFSKQTKENRSAVAKLFEAGSEYLGLFTNDKSEEEAVAALGKAFDNETFGRDFIGVLVENPLAVTQFTADSLAFMYAASKKGVALPFAAAFTGENYRAGAELYAETYGEQPGAEEKALILAGAGFIAALNSAASKYVTGEAGFKAVLSKIGTKGMTEFLAKTSVSLGQKIPDSKLKSIASFMLTASGTALKPAFNLSTRAGAEFLQEGSESLITKGSVFRDFDQTFTKSNLKEAATSGAIGFGSAAGTTVLFPGAGVVNLAGLAAVAGGKSLVEKGVQKIQDRPSEQATEEFREVVGGDEAVTPNVTPQNLAAEINDEYAALTDEAEANEIANDPIEFDKRSARLMAKTLDLASAFAKMSPEEKKANPDMAEAIQKVGQAIVLQGKADQDAKVKEITDLLNSDNEIDQQAGVDRVLGSSEEALGVPTSAVDKAISVASSPEIIAELEQIKNNKSLEQVAKDVLRGKPGSGFVGIKNRQYIAERLLRVGDVEGATAQLEEIRRFFTAHKDKSVALTEAYDAFLKTGVTQLVPKGNGTNWKIDIKSKRFVDTVKAEVEVITRVGTALANTIKDTQTGSDSTQSESSPVAESATVSPEARGKRIRENLRKADSGDAVALAELVAESTALRTEGRINASEALDRNIAQIEEKAKLDQEIADEATASSDEALAEEAAEQEAVNDSIPDSEIKNELEIKQGDFELLDVLENSKTAKQTTIDVPATKALQAKFSFLRVTLSTFFSRTGKSKTNNEQDPIDDTDFEALQLLNDQFKKFRNIAKKLPKLVGLEQKSLQTFLGKNGKLYPHGAGNDIMNDMASLLLSNDKNGKLELPDDVILASFIAAANWMSHQGKGTLYNDDKLINQQLSQSPNTTLTTAQRRAMQDRGSKRDFVAKTIGTDIFNSLSLKPNTAHPLSKEKMIMSLGLFAIKVMAGMQTDGKSTWLTEEGVSLGELGKLSNSSEKIADPASEVFFIRVTADSKDNLQADPSVLGLMEKFREAAPTISKLFNTTRYERKPSGVPIASVDDRPRGNLFKAGKKAVAKVLHLQQVPWTLNATADLTQKVSDELLKKISGYTDNVKETVHISQQSAVAAVNRQIEDGIQYATEQYEAFQDSKSEFKDGVMFFGYEIWSNSRVGMTSNTFDPQNSKYHRHIASPKSHKIKVNSQRRIDNFKRGVALAFDYNDKGDINDFKTDTQLKGESRPVETEFERIISDEIIQGAITAIREINSQDGSATASQESAILKAVEQSETKFHGLEALQELSTALDSNFKLKKTFNTSLSVETDGVTSGVILGLMQAPIVNNVQTWLARGGIFTGNYKNLGEAKADIPTDAYQQLVVDAVENMRENNPAAIEGVEAIIGKLIDADGKVTSTGRNLMKNPLMVFSYGAGPFAIKRHIASEIQTEIYNKLAATNGDKAAMSELSSNLKKLGVNIEFTDHINSELTPAEQEIFDKRIFATIGESAVSSLETNFAEMAEQRKVLLNALSIAFHTFEIKWQQAYVQYKADHNIKATFLSKDQKRELLASATVAPFIPFFNSPYGSAFGESAVSILGEEIIRGIISDENRGTSYFSDISEKIPAYKTTDGKTSKRKGQKSASGLVKVKRFRIDSVAALPKMIHTLDSTLILDTLNEFNGLNIHDAGMYSVADVDKATQFYNKKTFETSRDYSLIGDITRMVTNQTSKLSDADKKRVLAATIAEEQSRIKDEGSRESINENTDDFNDRIRFLNKLSQDIQAAKKNLFDNITHVHQAAYSSQSSVHSTKQKGEFSPMYVDFNYHPGSYDQVDVPMQTQEEWVDRTLQSSDENLSNFEASYENEATAVTSASIFNILSKAGTVRENGQHQRHLRGILDTVINKALKPTEKFIIQVGKDATGRNVGQIFGNTVQIQLGKHRPDLTLNQSAQEIYIHELLHGLTQHEIDNNFTLRRELTVLFKLAKANLTPSDFIEPSKNLTRTTSMDQAEAIAAQARYDYIFNNVESQKGKVSGSAGLHEFLAYGLSNENLVKKLSQIPFKQKREPASNLFEAIQNLFIKMMEFISTKLKRKVDVGDDVYSQLLDLTKDITAINEGWRFPIAGIFGSLNDKKVAFENSVFSNGDKLRKKLNTMIDADRGVVQQKLFTLVNTLKAVSHDKFGNTLIEWLQDHTEGDSFIAILMRELSGGSDEFRAWLPALRYSKERIDTARKAVKQNIISILGQSFIENSTDAEKEMLHDAILKTDLSALLPPNPRNSQIADVLKFFRSNAAIESEIQSIMDSFGASENKTYYQKQANNLGYFMATGNNTLEHANLNAYNIARLSLSGRANNALATKETVDKIDRLASLYAIKYISPQVKGVFTEYVERTLSNDAPTNAIRLILNLAADHKDFTRDNLFRGEAHSVIKGFTNELIDQNIAVKTAPLSEENELKKQGYTLAFKMAPIGGKVEKMGFFTAMNGAATTYTRTIFSTTSENVKGTTLTSAYINRDNPLVGRSLAKVRQNEVREAAMQNIEKQFNGKVPDLSKRDPAAQSPLIALQNAEGQSYEYRVILNHAMRKQHLNEDRRIDEVLGAMYGSMKDKLNTRQINKQVISDLFIDYQDNYDKEPEKFVRVGVNGKYGDVWAVIPEQNKEQIRSLTGRREMYIRGDVVDLVMGYRKFSLTDTKIAKKVLPESIRHHVDLAGKIWQEIVALGAVQIVVKTPVVLMDNVFSNTVMLLRDGLNPATIVRRHLEGIKALNDHDKDTNEEQRLILELQQDSTNKKNLAALAEVRESLKNNPVSELMDEGIFQSITEDININKYTSASTIANTKLGKAVNKTMPGFMTPIFQHAFMTKDTYLFKQFLKATQYSDFLARYTRYEFLKEKEGLNKFKGAEYTAKKNEILADLIEDYVNYDVPQHKMLQYANDMGMIRFTKYFLRTQRVIVKKWRQQPVNNLASVAIQQMVGDQPDINDSFIGFMNPLDKVAIFDVIEDAAEPKGIELAANILGL